MGTDHRRQGDVAVATRRKTAQPKHYRVILYNDDYTTMDFVVHVLQTIFRRSPDEAVEVMLKVHVEGRGIAGTYTHDVAETKVLAVHQAARGAGFPLRADLEEE